MKKLLVFIISILVIALSIAVSQVRSTTRKWKNAEANVKAYSQELSNEKNKSTAYKFTVNQLQYFNDSIVKALESTRKELRVKDKELQSLQAISTVLEKTDTLVFTDTIFSSPSLAIDTLILDNWCSTMLKLRYPSYIEVSPSFHSEKHIIVSTKKETVNPPKKFFLARWFQKKHRVLHVDVIEKNPYVKEQTSRFIEIIK